MIGQHIASDWAVSAHSTGDSVHIKGDVERVDSGISRPATRADAGFFRMQCALTSGNIEEHEVPGVLFRSAVCQRGLVFIFSFRSVCMGV